MVRKVVVALWFWFGSLGLAEAQPAGARSGRTALVVPERVVAGQLMVARYGDSQQCRRPSLLVDGRSFGSWSTDTGHHAFVPVALGSAGRKLTAIWRCAGRQAVRASTTVVAGDYRESVLSVDPRFSKRPPKRNRAEQRRISAALGRSEKTRLWKQAFVAPTSTSTVTSEYGVKRTFNNVIKSRHRGLDLDGAVGDSVLATNDGVVRLAARDYYYVGSAVVIDHGLGLFSLYFHLSSVDVEVGEWMRRGQKIGKVGKSGRVTGPHLHFAIKLAGQYIDPVGLLAYRP